jgi:hypothetical protein
VEDLAASEAIRPEDVERIAGRVHQVRLPVD